jgi:type IX secretion system substrate protein
MKFYLKILFIITLISFYKRVNAQSPSNNCNTGNAGAEITVGASCSYTSWNSTTSGDYWNSASGCGGSDEDDVWGWFTATSTSTTITYSADAGYDPVLHLFTGTCSNSMSSIACADNTGSGGDETITYATTIGTIYMVRIQEYWGSGDMFGDICVFNAGGGGGGGPANDLCAVATTLNCGDNLIGETTVGSSNTPHGTGCTMSDYGVWYTFTGDGQSTTITVSNSYDIELSISSGSCGTFTNIVCTDFPENHTFTTVAGTDYFVYVADWSSFGGSSDVGTFDISRTCSAPPVVPTNDVCATATTLDCGDNLIGESTVLSSNLPHGTACGMGTYGIWYTFTGDGQQTTITVSNSYDIELSISSGSCGTFTNIVCTDIPENHTFTTVVGTDYYVYVADWITGGSDVGTFDISRTCIPPPAPTCNDGILNQGETGVDCGGPCAACPPPSAQDCNGGNSICSDASFSGNSDGGGAINDLTASTEGCLSGEHETSWYFFEAATNGTLEFGIKPANGTDDYDFAVWGPYPSGSTPASICPPSSAPTRCSFAAGAPSNPAIGTGLVSGAGDNSEGVSGDDIVNPINMNTGDVYILLIDNYSGTTSPFDMDLSLTSGLTLNCTQLPIELLNFNGFAEKGYNLLEWTTTTEINNDYFEIEKSNDGVLFNKIDILDGAGNSSVNKFYQYKDNNPNSGISYYRLKQVDYNGTFSYSNVVAVKQSIGAEVSIFPNPTVGKVKLNFVSKYEGTYKITVYDISKEIYEEKILVDKGNKIISFNLFENLSKGFYIVKITDQDDNIIKTERIIKH